MQAGKTKILLMILCLVIAGFFAIALFYFLSCHPPVKEISKARALLTEAEKAGAPQYALEKYKEAENLLSQAKAESKTACRKSWKTVKLAQQKASEAKESAVKAKAQAQTEASKAIENASQALGQAKEAEAPKYAPNLYQAATNLLKEAQKDFQGGNYLKSKEEADKAAQLALKAKEVALKVKKELARRLKAKPTTHAVKKGECLWIISGYPKVYGDPFMWPLIYWANRAQIHDPDLIYPGQALAIPRNFTPHEKEKVIYFSKHRGPWSLFDGK